MKRTCLLFILSAFISLAACNHANTGYHSKADSTNATRHDSGNTPNDSDMSKMNADTTRH